MNPKSKRRAHQKQSATTDIQPRAAGQSSKVFYIFLAVVLMAAVIGYVNVFDQKLDLGGDNAAYYLLGKALASGQGYVNYWSPDKTPANHFPPGYPVIIAGVHLLSASITAVKIANGFFLLASVVILYLLLRHLDIDYRLAAIVCAAATLNGHLLRYSTIMMSEVPFLFFSLLALYLTVRLKLERRPYLDWMMLGLIGCLAFGYYIRTIGMAVVFGILVYFALKRAWMHIGVTLGGFFILILPWMIRGHRLGGNVYLEQLLRKNPYRHELGQMAFADIFTRVFKNFVRYVSKEIPGGCFPSMDSLIQGKPVWGWIIGVFIVLLVIWGIIRLRKYRILIAGYLTGTFGITLLWPDVWYGVRFIVAVIPLLIFLVFYGCTEALGLLTPSRRPGRLVLIPAMFLLFTFTPIQKQRRAARMPYPSNWSNYLQAANWAHRNTPNEALIACRKPELFNLFSSRHTIRYAFSKEPDAVIGQMEEKGVDYIIVDQLGFSSTALYLVPAVQANPTRFQTALHLQNPDTYVMKFLQK